MRLIDADALHKTKIVERKQIFVDGKRRVTNLYTEVVMSVHVENAPTIDPESLRPQGEWISRFARHWKGRDECSRCGFHEKDHRDLSHYNYCPNCGAKMVKEEKRNADN